MSGGGGYRVGLWQRLAQGGYTTDFVGSGFNGPASLWDHDHEGHSGWRIDQIDANVVNWVRTYQPRTVLLHIGTNDISQNRDLANAPNRLAAVVDKITEHVPADRRLRRDPRSRSSYADVAGPDLQRRHPRHRVEQGHRRQERAPRRHEPARSASPTSPTACTPTRTATTRWPAVWYAALRAVPGARQPGGRRCRPDADARPPAAPDSGPVDTSAWYTLVNRNSGKAIDVYNLSTADGARITAVVPQRRQPAAVAVRQHRQRLLQGEVATVGQGPRRGREVHRRRRRHPAVEPTTAAPTSSSASRRSTGTCS